MERHKCKLCSRTFSNGRALGGHMKAHLATLPIPPKSHHQPPLFPTVQSSFSLSSSSSYSSESEQEQSNREIEENKGVPTIYGLRENPKKSLWFSDPEFSACGGDGGGSVLVFVQDRESETESKNTTTTITTMTMMMTRQRSKRNRKISPNLQNDKKPKLSFVSEPPPPQATEPEPMVSSVSDASTEEDVAMCLMMLSRDTWKKKVNNAAKQDQEHEHDRNEERDDEIKKVKKVVRGKKNKNNECEGCGKSFRSSRALGSHRSICCRGESGTAGGGGGGDRVFECPFCFKIFGSGQALGGHKRSHLMGISATTSSSILNNDSAVLKKNSRESFIDLNLPASVEDNDGEFSAVSHVSDA